MGRYERVEELIQLVLDLQGSTLGLSLSDIEGRYSVSRRTAQRMRDAVRGLFPELEEQVLEDRTRYWRLPGRRGSALMCWKAAEIAALETAARFAEEAGRSDQAALLQGVTSKVRSLLDPAASCRLETDVAVLAEAEGLAMRPGPKPTLRDGIVEALREAILSCRCIEVEYRRSRTGEPVTRILHPYGFLYGIRHYLVAWAPWGEHVRIVQLSGIDRVSILPDYFERAEDFDLRRFASRSFGVFQEEPHDVVWRFAPEVSEAARAYVFHPTQSFEEQEDGSLLVRFQAGGIQEMAFHAFTWRGHLEVLEPKELRSLLHEMAAEVAVLHEDGSS